MPLPPFPPAPKPGDSNLDHALLYHSLGWWVFPGRSAVALERENARFAAAVADGVRVGGRPACSGACEPACPVCAAECGAADGVGGESCIGLA